MKNLVQRYVIARQKRDSEQNVVTVDDVNELKQEVSTFRSELLQILRESGMKTDILDDNNHGNNRESIVSQPFSTIKIIVFILCGRRGR